MLPRLFYDEAIQFLYSLRLFGAKLGLENTRSLAALAGNPHERLRFIHVAGTNGKGSTCAMLESVYRVAGLKTALFTSPHLVSFRERIQVNRQLIPERDVVRLLQRMQERLGQFPKESHPTFFEVVTVMALEWFAEQQCELVIWETGLGGRLDATNIVTPLVSVITNIDFDHQQWLGDTIDKIAAEKAGIIKPGVPVITAAQRGKGLETICDAAARLNAPIRVISEEDTTQPPLARLTLPLPGAYQTLNAATALATIQTLSHELPVSESAITTGLSRVQWPGRMQTVKLPSGQTVLLDGAHNLAGASLLAEHLKTNFPDSRPALVIAILGDKDWAGMANTLSPLSNRILLPPIQSDRALPPGDLLRACEQANPAANIRTTTSLAKALELTSTEPLVVITGSLYLVGQAIELLGLSPSDARNEQGLNEYGANPSSIR